MEERKKKPPIKLSELEEPVEPKHKSGALEYTGAKPSGSTGKKKPRDVMVQVLLSALLALVLSILVMSQYAPSKQALHFVSTNMSVMSAEVGDLRARLTGVGTKVENIINTMGTYAKKTEVMDLTTRVDTISKGDFVTKQALSSTLGAYATNKGVEEQLSRLPSSSTLRGIYCELSGSGSPLSIASYSDKERRFTLRVIFEPLDRLGAFSSLSEGEASLGGVPPVTLAVSKGTLVPTYSYRMIGSTWSASQISWDIPNVTANTQGSVEQILFSFGQGYNMKYKVYVIPLSITLVGG